MSDPGGRMRFLRSVCLLLAPLVLGVASPAPGADPPECPGPQNPGGIWKLATVDVYINPTLEPALERGVMVPLAGGGMGFFQLGNATTREQSFQAAVNEWNTALTHLCPATPLQLVLQPVNVNLWGVD